MYYEVFIPSPDAEGYDVTITVDAENWMSALKSGLERTGEGADAVRNVMCDIKDDNTIHVTDATTQRVFVLEELGEEAPEGIDEGESEPAGPDVGEELDEMAEESAGESEPAAEPADEQLEVVDEESERLGDEDSWTRDEDELEVGSSTHEALQDEEDEPKVVGEERKRTDEHSSVDVGRQDAKVSESLIEDIFLEIQPIHEGDKGMEEVVNYVMDLAMDSIDAESGSILFADTSGRELYFAAARGPKSNEVMDFRVPMGEGIVGFCSKEGVSLAVGDAQNDPRFYEKISESIGYETDSLLCAPVEYQGRVYGAVELINKKQGSTFTSNEMNALSYLGCQLAEYVNRVVMSKEEIDD
jgi:putative methionine-R-sulfoxide reductase with GAF domain